MLHALVGYHWSGAGYHLVTSLPGRLHQALLENGILGDITKDAAPAVTTVAAVGAAIGAPQASDDGRAADVMPPVPVSSTGARARVRRRLARGTSNPSRGFQSRSGEWAALREWTLSGTANIEKLEAERFFLCAQGVRGSGMLCVGGKDVAPFGEGDWEIEITAQAVDHLEIHVELRFAPGLPAGNPPVVRIGVDGGLFVRGINQLRVADWRVTPRIVEGYGMIESRVTVAPYVPGRYVFRYAAVYGDETLATEEITERLFAAEDAFSHRIVLPVPKWWKRNQENELVLLRLTVTRAGLVCDDRVLMVGFHDMRFTESSPKRLLLDSDTPLFLLGAEWSGSDSSLLTVDEIDRRLTLLHQAHVNCLRIVGDESDALYDVLDRRGFLFWQMLPSDPERALNLIRRVRHRPALIAYSGGTETAALVRDHDERHPFFGALPGERDERGPTEFPGGDALCAKMNRNDAWCRTIACPAPAFDPQELSGGETFWPPNNPLWAHRSMQPFRMDELLSHFDADITDMRTVLCLARMAQAETIRYTIERARMQEERGVGVFVQDPFDRFPSLHSTALFDETFARPGFWAMESAMRPVHVLAQLNSMCYACGATFVASVGLLCDTLVMGLLNVRAQLILPDGEVIAEAAFDAKPETASLGIVQAVMPEYPCALTLRLTIDRFGEVMDLNDYTICVSNEGRMDSLPQTPPASVFFADGKFQNDGTSVAFGVSGVAYKEACYPGWGAVLPGERRAVHQENLYEGVNVVGRG